jgi:hypothetical protein
LLLHYLIFLFVVFIIVMFCPISYSTHSQRDYISSIPLPLPPNPSNFTFMFDFVLDDSNPFEFLHYYSCALYNMVTFHVIGCSDLTIMVDKFKDNRCFWEFVYVLCLLFNQVLYIYLRTFCMILITLSQVLHTKFLWPPCRGNNVLLVMVVITLLVIAWFIILRKPSLHQELQVLWSRLWSKNSKLMTFSFDVMMFLRSLFHWIVWFLLGWGFGTTSFINEIIEKHSSI